MRTKKLILMIIIINLMLCMFNNHSLAYRLLSTNKNYQINIKNSMIYKTEVFGDPFGREDLPDKGFYKTEEGFVENEKGEKGEYAHIGFNFDEFAITNDRYFRQHDRRGNVFDQNYANVVWQDILPEALKSWNDIIKNPVLLNYMLTTNFYDEDHVTGGKTDTGFNLLKLFNIPEGSTDYSEIFRKAWVLTTPDTGSAHIRLRYNDTNWNTIRIPAIPTIECIMTAEADKEAIETGKTESVTVKIDTSHSYWVMADQESKNISVRRYWAGTSPDKVESEIVTTQDNVCYITLHNVSPNTMIYVWSSVTSHEIETLGFNGTDEAVATLFVGEISSSGAMVSGNRGRDEQFTSPETQVVIKADPRGNERFDVSQGIPSGEPLYVNILASEYLYRLGVRQVTGSVTDTVTVYHPDEEGNIVESQESFTRSYSYYEITSLEVYAIKSATLVNGALPGGKITITPSAAYKRPDVEFVDIADHVSTGSSSYATTYDTTPEGIRAAASSSLPTLTVKNDILKINGKVIMSEHGFYSERLKPGLTNSDALFQSGLKIPPEVLNQTYATTGTITYERVYSVNPRGAQEMTFPLEGNSVSVHTPVCIDMTISDEDAYNQKPNPNEEISGLVLARPFTVSLSNQGPHRNIPGYGTRDYSAYVKNRQIRFDFDVYLGTDREGVFLKGNTWHSLNDLGIDTRQDKITFYVPTWVDEGIHEIEVRSLATNDNSNGSKTEE